MEFFENQENQATISKCISALDSAHKPFDQDSKHLEPIKRLLERFQARPDLWDKYCSFNIEHIGPQFIQGLNRLASKSDPENIQAIYTSSYRFLCERIISFPDKEDEGLHEIRNLFHDNIGFLEAPYKRQLRYADHFMPSKILKELIHHKNIGQIEEFNKKASEAETLRKTWDDELSKKQAKVEILEKKLKTLTTGFNFVGLHQGFAKISRKKEIRKSFLQLALFVMAIIILAPITLEIIIVTLKHKELKELGSTAYLFFLPTIALEAILIYYFRILLHNYKSITSQLIQLDLRKTLCEFIQEYADYSQKIKEKDRSALEKFENLIFSGLVASDEKLPSTYDGIDQLSKMIKSLKQG